jgi:hypothetical protein
VNSVFKRFPLLNDADQLFINKLSHELYFNKVNEKLYSDLLPGMVADDYHALLLHELMPENRPNRLEAIIHGSSEEQKTVVDKGFLTSVEFIQARLCVILIYVREKIIQELDDDNISLMEIALF